MTLHESRVMGVVNLLASGVTEPAPWFAMELVEGPDLTAFLRDLKRLDCAERTLQTESDVTATVTAPMVPGVQGDTPEPSTIGDPSNSDASLTANDTLNSRLRIGMCIAQTLARVHALGLLHGDLTPSNVVLRSDGQPVLLDFGTSYAVFERTQFREPVRHGFERYGTPGYAAPEVLRGDSTDARCDVYGLGCILFELVFRQRVFTGGRVEDLVRQHLHAAPRIPVGSDVPAELAEILLRMLAKSPGQRLSDLQTVIDTLSRLLGEGCLSVTTSSKLTLLRPRFVGETEPLRSLDRCLDRACDGSGGAVLIAAPSGAGKTRLLNELGAAATGRGATVVCCQAATTESSNETQLSNPGLSLFSPLLWHAEQVYQRIVNGPASAAAKPHWDDVASVLQLGRTGGKATLDTDPLSSPAAEKARERTFDALQRGLELLAQRQPLVLLFDDLQWADELSLAFLSARARRLSNSRILLVASTRDDSNPERLAELRGWAPVEVRILPLQRSACADLVKDLLGVDALPEGLLDYIQVRSEGNPFFIGEYLRAAHAWQLLRRSESGEWQFPTPSELHGREQQVPRTVDDLITARVEALSIPARQVLSQAAVLGREFDEALLVEWSDDGALSAFRALQELVAHQLLTQLSPGRYRFVHDHVRESAEHALPDDVRRTLHRRAARAIESQGSRDTAVVARLGYHWAAADEPAAALHYLKDAAARARRDSDVDFACELYRAAIVQAGKRPDAIDCGELVNLNEALGEALVMRARHTEARRCYTDAYALSSAGERLLRGRLKRREAATYWTLHDYATAERLLRQARQELGKPSESDGDDIWQEHIQIHLGIFEYLYYAQRNGTEIDALMDALEGPVRRYGTARQRNAYYVASCGHQLLRGRYAYSERAVEFARLALRACEELPLDQKGLGHLGCGFALVFGNQEHCREALMHLTAGVDAARQTQGATLLARASTYRALTLLRLHDAAELERFLPEMAAAAEAARLPPYIAAAQAFRGWLEWRRGEPSAAEHLEKARAGWLTHSHPFPFRWIAGFPLLALAHSRDDHERAQALLLELLEPGQQALLEPLASSIREAATACRGNDVRATERLIAAVMRLAHDFGYC